MGYKLRPALLSLTMLILSGLPALSDEIHVSALQVEPSELTLKHARDAQRILVSGLLPNGEWTDLTGQARITTDESVVTLDSDGFVAPKGEGKAQVKIFAGGKEITLPVTVESVQAPPVSFVREVMPLLSKIGCNAGACHGSAKGKNGFKLSLRGYDAEYDYAALVRDITGRRFNRVSPEESLMLLKPTQGVPHEGGQLFTQDSRTYRLLHQWISEGVKSDVGQNARPQTLEVSPSSRTLGMPGESQQFKVMAVYEDGQRRDVTRDAGFTSSVPDVATVSDSGLVTAARRGESAVLVRYEGVFSTQSIIVMGDRSGFEWKDLPSYTYVDDLIYSKLKSLKIIPSDLCTDDEFIRRAYLDLTGKAPTPEQVLAYLKDETDSKTKREKLVDELLETDDSVEHWTNKIADLLNCNREFLGERGMWLYRLWIRDAVAQNKPYDQFVRDLLLATGSTYKNPAANFFRVNREPNKAVENVTQVFLGVRFQCAKCHDHPFEKWTQNQYYQLGSFFRNVDLKSGTLPDEEIVYTRLSEGEVLHPKTNKPVAALVPYGQTDETEQLRQQVAEWLTSKENHLFARSTVNRFWSYLMGRGIIEPVDDIRNSNPPSNPELLDALEKDFVEHNYDLRHLIRTICKSRVYQLSIVSNQWNQDDSINFSHTQPRRLSAEQLLDSIAVATGARPVFEGVPDNFRACELPDNKAEKDGFLKLFGKPDRQSACECERSDDLSLAHAMNLINGPTVSNAINDPEGRVAKLVKENSDPDRLVDELYLAVLSRHPKTDEAEKAKQYLAKSETLQEGGQDLMWALINSPAFLFNR